MTKKKQFDYRIEKRDKKQFFVYNTDNVLVRIMQTRKAAVTFIKKRELSRKRAKKSTIVDIKKLVRGLNQSADD